MSSTKTELKAKLAKKKASLIIAETTYDELLAGGNESYRFDSSEGSQSTKKRKLQEVKDQIDSLESEIEGICRRLNGSGLTRVSLKRNIRY